MRRMVAILLVTGMAMEGGSAAWSQAAAPTAAAGGGGATASAASAPATPDTKTEKQKALAMQTERLFNMATELKAQVDLTNKNILSLKVVEKAEAIEALAKGMRGQAKK